MAERIITLTDGFIHVPIKINAKKTLLHICTEEGETLAQFHVELSTEKPFDYYPFKAHQMEGKTIRLSAEGDGAEDALAAILVGGSIEERSEIYPDLYNEPERQQVHFSSRRGWLNDPNALVYAGGKFRMCFQHNPLGNLHGGVNISWGLAESEDGVHFKEYPDALYPSDCLTIIASGSAIVDTDNISGMGKGTIIGAYTALESDRLDGYEPVGNRGQMLVYSTDGGYTFKHFPNNPIIPVASDEGWRDPKILRLDDETFCIAVYETYEGVNCVSFYSSSDCVNWKFESRTMDLFECPDLFPLPVLETGETKWVLYGANGMYRVGDFKDYKFTQIGESQYLDYGRSTYAGQTWNDHPDTEGRYHIAWMAEDDRCAGTVPFAQSMSLICRFTLHKTDDGYRLFRNPIEALDTLRGDVVETTEERKFPVEGSTWDLPMPSKAEFVFRGKFPCAVMVNGQGFIYDPARKHLVFTSGKEYTLTTDTAEGLTYRIITDVRSVEFFINGEISASFFNHDREKKLCINGTDAAKIQGCIRHLKSIWG